MRLIVDGGTSKVLFAETDETFVDILFSLLTLPVGVVCRLRHRRKTAPNFGCMDNLFTSLMNLDPMYFKNAELKLILSSPKRSFQARYWSLVKDEPSQIKKYCLCRSRVVQRNKICRDNKLSSCACGIPNYCKCDSCPKVDNKDENDNGLLFLRNHTEFIVADDFKLAPVHRAASVLSSLQDMGIRLTTNVEEVEVSIEEKDKVLNLLMRSLVSPSPLSDVFCPAREGDRVTERKAIEQKKADGQNNAMTVAEIKPRKIERMESSSSEATLEAEGERKEEIEVQATTIGSEVTKSKEITISLIMDMVRRRVLFAEAGEDFVDLLFNFLTYPLGSVAQLTDGHPIMCFRNLCRSLSALDTNRYFKSERCKQMLLSPELPHQLCESLLPDPPRSREQVRRSLSSRTPTRESSVKNGVLKDSCVFMVTNDLVITPLTSMSVISILDEFNCHPTDVEERKVVVDVKKARDLLLASLISTTALSSTFFPDDEDSTNSVNSIET